MKRKMLLCLIPALVLAACSSGSKDKDYEDWDNYTVTEHDWTDERDYTYSNYLTKPSTTVHDIEDLVAITDYYAFYKTERFTVTVADDYEYSVPGKHDLKHELNYLYWAGGLINGVMGMNAKASGDKWLFQLDIYHDAYRNSTPFFVDYQDLIKPVAATPRSADYDDFATEDPDKPVCDVATTQQLYYAAQMGYRINPIKDSPADVYYTKCKDLLNTIISDGMDDFEKAKAIYDYISHTVTYDYAAAYTAEESDDPDLYPDVNVAGDKCYYIEGLFDQKLLVCDGLAKCYTTLGRMEGLNIVRASGTADTSFDSREQAGHAYCFIEIEDHWYLSDLTWGMFQTSVGNSYIEANEHNYFLTAHDAIAPYTSVEWPEIQESLYQHVDGSPDQFGMKKRYFSSTYFEYGGKTYPMYLTDDNAEETINAILGLAAENRNVNNYVNVYCSTAAVAKSFVEKMKMASYYCYGMTTNGSEPSVDEYVCFRPAEN